MSHMNFQIHCDCGALFLNFNRYQYNFYFTPRHLVNSNIWSQFFYMSSKYWWPMYKFWNRLDKWNKIYIFSFVVSQRDEFFKVIQFLNLCIINWTLSSILPIFSPLWWGEIRFFGWWCNPSTPGFRRPEIPQVE